MVELEGPRPLSVRVVAQLIFLPKVAQKIKIKLKYDGLDFSRQSIDNSLLRSHKKFQPNWPTIGRVMAKKLMPEYGMCA